MKKGRAVLARSFLYAVLEEVEKMIFIYVKTYRSFIIMVRLSLFAKQQGRPLMLDDKVLEHSPDTGEYENLFSI
jgi:hypothetical protein